MSTHNICFMEKLRKIISELRIIKYSSLKRSSVMAKVWDSNKLTLHKYIGFHLTSPRKHELQHKKMSHQKYVPTKNSAQPALWFNLIILQCLPA